MRMCLAKPEDFKHLLLLIFEWFKIFNRFCSFKSGAKTFVSRKNTAMTKPELKISNDTFDLRNPLRDFLSWFNVKISLEIFPFLNVGDICQKSGISPIEHWWFLHEHNVFSKKAIGKLPKLWMISLLKKLLEQLFYIRTNITNNVDFQWGFSDLYVHRKVQLVFTTISHKLWLTTAMHWSLWCKRVGTYRLCLSLRLLLLILLLLPLVFVISQIIWTATVPRDHPGRTVNDEAGEERSYEGRSGFCGAKLDISPKMVYKRV